MSALWSAMAVVFVAELGDKTQLVALGLGARHRFALVATGLAIAYVASGALSVAVGTLAGAALPTDVVSVIGGLLFLGFAIWTLLDDRDRRADAHDAGDDDPTSERQPRQSAMGTEPAPARVVATVAVAMFVAELGDKTMLATATLAARGNPLAVWIGATIGIFLAGMMGAVIGRSLGDRLPDRAIRIGAATLFALFGVALLASAR